MIYMNSKAQVDIISAVIIIAIAIGLTATAYSWGIPLIQKRQHEALAERVHIAFDQNKISSLPSKIESIAKAPGAEETFTLDVDGAWILCPSDSSNPYCGAVNNSIEFTFLSKASRVAVGQWSSLTPGGNCIPPISSGILGLDRSSVVCARADVVGDVYNITYRIYFRELFEEGANRGYKINLIKDPRGSLNSTGKTIRISRGDVRTETIGAKTLIITEIKILL
jgi:hypothetical protein